MNKKLDHAAIDAMVQRARECAQITRKVEFGFGRAGRKGAPRHVPVVDPDTAIDQYAEAALGSRDFFLNRPHSVYGMSDACVHEGTPALGADLIRGPDSP